IAEHYHCGMAVNYSENATDNCLTHSGWAYPNNAISPLRAPNIGAINWLLWIVACFDTRPHPAHETVADFAGVQIEPRWKILPAIGDRHRSLIGYRPGVEGLSLAPRIIERIPTKPKKIVTLLTGPPGSEILASTRKHRGVSIRSHKSVTS